MMRVTGSELVFLPQAKFSLLQKIYWLNENQLDLKKKRAIPGKKTGWGGGGGGGGDPTTHVFRKVHIPTTYRIKYDNVY